MNIKSIKNELQNILSGTSGYSYDAVIQAVTNHLRTGERTSPMAEGKHENKRKETAKLVTFALPYNKKIVKSDKFISLVDTNKF
jgi:hypothetical protein